VSHRALPAQPNLEQYKKQAKNLLKAYTAGSPEALARVQERHPRFDGLTKRSFQLVDAQHAVAREYGFESWPKFASFLSSQRNDATIRVDGVWLCYEIVKRSAAKGVILLPHLGSHAASDPKNRALTDVFHDGGYGVVIADLLTEEEELAELNSETLRFDIRLLGRRIVAITDWMRAQAELRHRDVGYCASDTAAAAALFAAAERPEVVRAVVSRGGRPDLAGPWLWKVKASTLVIAGGKDLAAANFNRAAAEWFSNGTPRRFDLIAGVGQRLEEARSLEKSADLALYWFRQYMKGNRYE
jgi:putative phosphoribosyl transferase